MTVIPAPDTAKISTHTLHSAEFGVLATARASTSAKRADCSEFTRQGLVYKSVVVSRPCFLLSLHDGGAWSGPERALQHVSLATLSLT